MLMFHNHAWSVKHTKMSTSFMEFCNRFSILWQLCTHSVEARFMQIWWLHSRERRSNNSYQQLCRHAICIICTLYILGMKIHGFLYTPIYIMILLKYTDMFLLSNTVRKKGISDSSADLRMKIYSIVLKNEGCVFQIPI